MKLFNRTQAEQLTDYEILFIHNAPNTTRSGKTVYIRKEFHDRMMRIAYHYVRQNHFIVCYSGGSIFCCRTVHPPSERL